MFKDNKVLSDIKLWEKLIKESIEYRKSEEQDMYKEAIIAMSTLSEYVFHIRNYCVDIKECIKVVRKYAKNYEIQPINAFELLLNITLKQPPILKKYASTNIDTILNNNNKQLEKYEGIRLIIGKSISYVNDISTLRNILLLNKNINLIVKPYVYYNVLFILRLPLNISMHTKIWEQLLNKDNITKPTTEYSNKINERSMSNLIK
jgi:hypothetical protein